MISVTQILEQFPEKELIDWQLRVGKVKAQQISEEALQVGKIVDEAVQDRLKLKQPVLMPDQATANCMEGFEKFLTDHPSFPGEILGLQQELIADDIIGHPDFLLQTPKGWGVGDLKCASQIRPQHWTQVAAYALLRGRQVPQSPLPTFLAILRLDKTSAQYDYQELTDPVQITDEIEVFRAYVTLYQHRLQVAERARQWKEKEMLR